MFNVQCSMLNVQCSMKNKYLSLILLLLTACSSIGEEDRLIYVKPQAAKRVVLLEDFTGQKCVNCPDAHEVIDSLQKDFGPDSIIAVAIHGGDLALYTNAKFLGLRTQTGDEYFDYWNFDYQPVGLINRHGAKKHTDWTATVIEEMTKPAPLDLNVQALLNEGNIDIQVSAFGTDGSVVGKLQLWAVEDSITAMQMMPNNKIETEYVHNHVFRAAVNGSWGDDFTITEGESVDKTYTFQPDAAWKPEHLSIVAFVYNAEGVMQAARSELRIKNEE
jgi:hypothetical protein